MGYTRSSIMKYLVTSDIHLGHARTPTKHIILNFNTYILNDENKDIDVLFISGDLFDRGIDFDSEEARDIIIFIQGLLEYCYVNDIELRVLLGTPSHDLNTPSIIPRMNNNRKQPCKLKYFEVLDIEYLERIQKYVLYIPDEWTNSHEDLEQQIQEKLLQHNISKVDIGILHGQFKYQLPIPDYKGFYFHEEYFLNLVKGYIHVGHYHTYTYLDRIIANGSLDRLRHNEEEAKGYVIVNNDSYRFVENDNAYIYKTVRVTAKTSLESLDKHIRRYPSNSYIRIVVDKDHPYCLNFQDLKLRYKEYYLEKKLRKDTTEDNTPTNILLELNLEDQGGYTLEGNIHDVLYKLITTQHALNSVELSRLNYHLTPLEKLHAEDQS